VKTCLRAVLENGQPGRLLDVSFVSDDHKFGVSPDGTEIHVPGRGEFTVTRGREWDGERGKPTPPKPPAVNGIPFSEILVNEDGTIAQRLEIRRRDPAEAAVLIRAGYADLGIPREIAEAMIEETLKP
jgi:hypothetical protein